MKTIALPVSAIVLAISLAGTVAAARVAKDALEVYPSSVTVAVGQSQQIIVSPAGSLAGDLTGDATYKVQHPEIASVTKEGIVRSISPGSTSVAIRVGGRSIDLTVTVVASAGKRSFRRDVMPILSSMGCNLGICHGKATGQRGFKLSLFETDAEADYRALAHEARGRRLFPAAPERSLVLLKATGTISHGGGRRFEQDSDTYRAIHEWISQGAQPPTEMDARVISLICNPKHAVLGEAASQQVVVEAIYSNGTRSDVTRQVVYEVDDPEMVSVNDQGRIQVADNGGLFSVLIRFGTTTTTFQGTVPYRRNSADQELLATTYDVLDKQFGEQRINQLMLAQWRRLAIAPSPQASDESFIRRVSVDICGTLPTAQEVRDYRNDAAADKKLGLVNRLLERPAYANYFAVKWADVLQNRGRGYSTKMQRPGTALFYGWIRDSFAENKPFDQFAAEIVSASGSQAENPPAVWYRSVRTLPNFVESVAQAFLGVRIQCAQCHHHPFDRWTQGDYFGLAAVFARVGRKGGFADAEVPTSEVIFLRDKAPVFHPKTGELVRPRPLGGPDFELGLFDDPRHALGNWFSDPANPFFARAMVNRTWSHFLGRGLVDPIDDARATNPPANPELLQLLTARFIDSKFDVKQLIREICLTYAYELESGPVALNQDDTTSFARFYPRRMTAEVLLDGISQVLDVPTVFPGGPGAFPVGTRAIELPDENVPVHFLDVFGRPSRNKACECERVSEATLGQALALVNSAEIQQKLAADDGYVSRLAAADGSHKENVGEVFLRVLGRDPSEAEIAVAVEFLEGENDRVAAYRSFVWSLLATNEFLFMH